MNEEERKALFSKLFGFKVGARVKRKRRSWYTGKTWWEYGTVVRVRENSTRELYVYSVRWDNRYYARLSTGKELLAVRSRRKR